MTKSPSTISRYKARVTGRVQGVNYRANTAQRARELGLVGWVKNNADLSVSFEAEGPLAIVQTLIDFCRKGPGTSRVDSLDADEIEPTGGTDFEVRW